MKLDEDLIQRLYEHGLKNSRESIPASPNCNYWSGYLVAIESFAEAHKVETKFPCSPETHPDSCFHQYVPPFWKHKGVVGRHVE